MKKLVEEEYGIQKSLGIKLQMYTLEKEHHQKKKKEKEKTLKKRKRTPPPTSPPPSKMKRIDVAEVVLCE